MDAIVLPNVLSPVRLQHMQAQTRLMQRLTAPTLRWACEAMRPSGQRIRSMRSSSDWSWVDSDRGLHSGCELRSTSPAAPSAMNRANHLKTGLA